MLYVGGVGLARAYLYRAELTAQRFIPDPLGGKPGERLFKTGDLACYLPDGTIKYLGRADHQVKIRGFRVESGEVEKALSQHPAVRDVIVVAREEASGDKRLVAYVVVDEECAPTINSLRGFIRAMLPEYMTPSAFVLMDKFPLTPSKKVNRLALPAPDYTALGVDATFAEARTPVEEVVAGIWSQVLRLGRVGVHDNFFESGGHSLLATQAISRLRKAFPVEISLRSLFEEPTVSGLAKVITEAMAAGGGLQPPPIERVPRDGELPLSFAQQRLWFLGQLAPNGSAYNIPAAVRLRGELSRPVLEASFKEIILRHEVLRTSFASVDGRPVQVISDAADCPLHLIDLSALGEQGREAEALRLAALEGQQPFDLRESPVMRIKLLRLDERDHVILLTMHHIVSDRWSMSVMVSELAALYEAFRNHRPSPLADLAIQYADFAHWQREWLKGEVLEAQLSYWKDHLAAAPTVLELPTDRPRPVVQTSRGAIQPFAIPEELTRLIEDLCRKTGATMFMTLLAAFGTLLWRYTRQEDILIGAPIANRNRTEVEGLIGYFANTLVIRTNLSGNPRFIELLGRVREAALGAYVHQDLPFEQVVEALHPDRDLSRSPVFQVLFALHNTPRLSLHLQGLDATLLQRESSTARFDLSLELLEDSDRLAGFIEYNTDLFDAATIKRLIKHFQAILESVTGEPGQRLPYIELITAAERHQILKEWNCAPMRPPEDQTVHTLFEAQAETAPDAVAVACGQTCVSYRELNERANRLAHYLKARGVGPEVVVGICIERSVEMVCGLLAILKAGGAYLPLDPEYPQQRLDFMLDDTRAPVVVTTERLAARFKGHRAQVVCLDSGRAETDREAASNPINRVDSAGLAYVIYTSGSTGKPRGVAVAHDSVASLFLAALQVFDFSRRDVWTVFHSFGFDLSVWEIWGALLTGGRLVVVPLRATRSPSEFWGLLKQEEVTILNQTPSAIRHLVEAGGEHSPDEMWGGATRVGPCREGFTLGSTCLELLWADGSDRLGGGGKSYG
jgi:non-ribosomal peptide synthetase component F